MSANPTDGLDSSSISGSRPVRSKQTYKEESGKLLDADHMRICSMHAVCLLWRFRAATPTTTILLLQGPLPIQTLDAACNDDQDRHTHMLA